MKLDRTDQHRHRPVHVKLARAQKAQDELVRRIHLDSIPETLAQVPAAVLGHRFIQYFHILRRGILLAALLYALLAVLFAARICRPLLAGLGGLGAAHPFELVGALTVPLKDVQKQLPRILKCLRMVWRQVAAIAFGHLLFPVAHHARQRGRSIGFRVWSVGHIGRQKYGAQQRIVGMGIVSLYRSGTMTSFTAP